MPRLASFDVCSRNGRQARPVARVVGEQAHGPEVRAGVRGGRRVVCPVDLDVRRLVSRPGLPCQAQRRQATRPAVPLGALAGLDQGQETPFELSQALTLSNTHIARLWRQRAFLKSVETPAGFLLAPSTCAARAQGERQVLPLA